MALGAAACTFYAGAAEARSACGLWWLASLYALWLTYSSAARSTPLRAPTVALWCVGGVGIMAWVAPHPFLALASCSGAACTALLFLALLNAPFSRYTQLIKFFGALMLGHAAVALLQWAGLLPVWFAIDGRTGGGFFNPNDLGAFLVPGLIVAGAAFVERGGRGSLGALALLGGGLCASGSRAAALAAAGGLGLVAVAGRRQRGRSAALGGVGCLLLGGIFLPRLALADPYPFSRWAIWRRCVQIAWTHPGGVGLGDFATALRQAGLPLPGWVRYPYFANHAHNELLQAWVEMGWIGLLLAALPACWSLRLALRRLVEPVPWQARRSLHVALWLGFALPASLSNTLHVPPIALLAAVWAAYLARRPGVGGAMPRRTSPTARRLVLGGLAAVTMLAALPGALRLALLQHSRQAQGVGNWSRAQRAADWALRVSPWSCAAALQNCSVAFQVAMRQPGAQPAAVVQQTVDRLAELGDRFPTDARPWQRAALLLQEQLRRGAAPAGAAGWRQAAHCWLRAAQAEPHNALFCAFAGQAFERADAAPQARAAFEAALQREPHCSRALLGLARHLPERAAALRQAASTASQQARHYVGYPAQVLTL